MLDARPVFDVDGDDDHGPDVPALPNTRPVVGDHPCVLASPKMTTTTPSLPPPEDPGFGDVNDDDHESDVDAFDDHVPDVNANPNQMQVQGPKHRGQLKDDDHHYSQSTHAGNSLIDPTQLPDQDVPNSTQQQGARSRQTNVRFSDKSTMESSTGSVNNTSPPERRMSTATANKCKLPQDQATPPDLVPAPSPDPSTSPDQVSGTSQDPPSGTSAAQESVTSPLGLNRTTSTNTIQADNFSRQPNSSLFTRLNSDSQLTTVGPPLITLLVSSSSPRSNY